MRVEIPFWDMFKDPMLRGDKVMTTRSKKYGNKGDIFDKFGATFRISLVKKLPIALIANEFYDAEGFDTREDFIKIWEKIHPIIGYQPEKEYWCHLFALIV